MNVKHRIIALVGGGLLAAGLAIGSAGTVSAATIPSSDHHNGRCTVRLDERGDRLRVEIRSDSDNDRARVRANYDRGGDQSDAVRLNRQGNGDTTFRIPDQARRVTVQVNIDDSNRRRHHDVSCSESIRLR